MKQEHNKEKEIWLPLVHLFRFPQDGNFKYEISNLGKIRQRKKDGTYKPVKVYRNCEGYNVVSLQTTIGTFNRMYLHRLVAVVFLSGSNITGSSTVNHKNENKDDNRVSNLEWMPLSENIRLAHKSGAIRNKGFEPHPVKISKLNKEYKFHTLSQCANFLGCSIHAVLAGLKNHYNPKGWKIESLKPNVVNGNIFRPEDFE